MSLDYKPFQQSRPPTKLKEATFVSMKFHFIAEWLNYCGKVNTIPSIHPIENQMVSFQFPCNTYIPESTGSMPLSWVWLTIRYIQGERQKGCQCCHPTCQNKCTTVRRTPNCWHFGSYMILGQGPSMYLPSWELFGHSTLFVTTSTFWCYTWLYIIGIYI